MKLTILNNKKSLNKIFFLIYINKKIHELI